MAQTAAFPKLRPRIWRKFTRSDMIPSLPSTCRLTAWAATAFFKKQIYQGKIYTGSKVTPLPPRGDNGHLGLHPLGEETSAVRCELASCQERCGALERRETDQRKPYPELFWSGESFLCWPASLPGCLRLNKTDEYLSSQY